MSLECRLRLRTRYNEWDYLSLSLSRSLNLRLTMSYEISLPENRKYVYVRVTEAITIELARRFSKDSAVLGRKHNLNRFLFDVREARNVARTLLNYQFVHKEMAALDLDKAARSAILVSPADKSHDFVETLARNAGYNVRLFTDAAAAIGWLEEE